MDQQHSRWQRFACLVAAALLGAAVHWYWSSPPPVVPQAPAPQADAGEPVPNEHATAAVSGDQPTKSMQAAALPAAPERSVAEVELAEWDPPKSIEEQVREILLTMRNPLTPEQRAFNRDKVDDVQRNPEYNPEGKLLTLEQRAALAQLIVELHEQFMKLGDVQHAAHADATMRALESGQYVYIEMGRTGAENYERVNKVKEVLSARYGTELKDWRSHQSFRTGTHGTSWIALLYYTRQQSPEAFELADELMQMFAQRKRRYREFFAGLR